MGSCFLSVLGLCEGKGSTETKPQVYVPSFFFLLSPNVVAKLILFPVLSILSDLYIRSWNFCVFKKKIFLKEWHRGHWKSMLYYLKLYDCKLKRKKKHITLNGRSLAFAFLSSPHTEIVSFPATT